MLWLAVSAFLLDQWVEMLSTFLFSPDWADLISAEGEPLKHLEEKLELLQEEWERDHAPSKLFYRFSMFNWKQTLFVDSWPHFLGILLMVCIFRILLATASASDPPNSGTSSDPVVPNTRNGISSATSSWHRGLSNLICWMELCWPKELSSLFLIPPKQLRFP